jgi:S1-C subfamily serine protease
MIIDILQKITTPIICKSGRSIVSSATGFFFRFKEKTFLITNRHVFINEERNFYPDKIIIILNKEGNDLTQSEEITYNLYEENLEKPTWLQIDKTIDLAALEIPHPKHHILAALTPENLPKDLFLALGEQVLVIGYPKGFYDDIHNLPIVRSACVASAYGVPFKKQPIFLIDSNLHPGTSGSPVITVPKNIYQNPDGGFVIGGNPIFYFLGVHSGTFDDLQLNAVWYSNMILKLLEQTTQTILNLPPTSQNVK